MGIDNQPVRVAQKRSRFFAATAAASTLAVLTLFAVASVHAQPSDIEKAKAHYLQGEAYFKAGTFDKAIEEYEKAYALGPAPVMLFNIALAHEKNETRDMALEFYQRYLIAAPSGNRATEARARSEALKRALEQENARAAAIKGHRVRADALSAEGKHIEAIAELKSYHRLTNQPTVLFEIAGAYEKAGESDLARIEYTKYIDTGDRTHADEALAKRQALKKKDVFAIPAKPKAKPRPITDLIAPVSATAVTAVVFGIGAAFGLRKIAIENQLRDHIDTRNPPLDNSDPRFDEGRTAANLSAGFLTAALVGAGVSGYLWWRYFSHSPSAQDSENDGPTGPTTYIAPTGTGVSFGGTF